MNARNYLALAVVAGMTPLFFIDLGAWRQVFAPEIHIFGHLLYFALLGWLILQAPVLQRYSFAKRGIAVLAIALLLGASIELVQPLFDRTAGFRDVWQNVLGAAIAVALAAPAGAKRRSIGGLVAVVLFLELQAPVTSLWDRGVARLQFPVLSDFSTAFEHRRWSRGQQDDGVTRGGHGSLRVDLPPARFAGTTMRRSLGDWSDFEALSLSIYNAEPVPLIVTVSIRDDIHLSRGGAYDDRFNRRFQLLPGWNDIRIPVEDVQQAPSERTMRLNRIVELAIFTTNLEQPHRLYLDTVQLTDS
ncbi:VanZ family protein [Aquisalimonas sp.]|uniref:VanZ family protein n=1 Tax=unclassified Aquisalimonas TaxID=2644645 RepID=UPI0025C38085|nr:VanZ family protein [Aquisalimonas sp.]